MNKSEIKKLAIKELNSKHIKSLKTQLCKYFTFNNVNERRDCISEFDKNFIESFIHSYQNRI